MRKYTSPMAEKMKDGDFRSDHFKYLTLLLGSSASLYRNFYLILASFYSEHRIWGKQKRTKCTGSTKCAQEVRIILYMRNWPKEAAAIVVSSVAVATRQFDSCQRLQQQNKTKQRISPFFCRWQCGWSQRPISICLVSKTQHHKCWLGNNVSCMHSILKFFK